MATEEDKTNSAALATLVAVLAFAMIGVSLAVTALTRDELAGARAEKEESAGVRYQEMKREQKSKLAAGVPIEQAMQQVVEGLKRDPGSATPPGSAVAAPGAAPVGSEAPAAGGSAAPAGSAAAPMGSGGGAATPSGSAAAPEPPASAMAPSSHHASAPQQQSAGPGAALPAKPVAPAAAPAKPQSAPAAPAAPAAPPPAHS